MTKSDFTSYHNALDALDAEICKTLTVVIDAGLTVAESKIWHGHPVWFLDGNPIVGYSKQKKGIRLMFWSGADFDDEKLNVRGEKFKDASIFYNQIDEIKVEDINHWLQKSITIQWDYKNIVRRKGRLEKMAVK
ncbi:MAG: DUF1801 domain-containing protein [Saprospiraceae bacterium]|jgi:hypothetical protein